MKEDVPHIQKPMTPEMKEYLGELRKARQVSERIRLALNKPPLPTTPNDKPIYLLPPSWNGKDFKLYKKTHKRP